MEKRPTDFLNFPRRGTISGVQNVTVYCKIEYSDRIVPMGIQWSLTQGLYKTFDPLLLYPIEPEKSTPEKSAFCTEPFRTVAVRVLSNFDIEFTVMSK